VEDDDVARRQLEELHRLAHGAAAFVVEGLGLEQQQLDRAVLRADLALAGQALEARTPRRRAPFAGQGVDRHEPDIVAVLLVFRLGIAETGEDQHRVGPNWTSERKTGGP
jgi:hypothetical protein